MDEERWEAPVGAIEFIADFGRALHRFGSSAPRVEEALEALARRFAVRAEFMATPTAIFCAFGKGAEQRTLLARVEPGDVDLEKLSLLHALSHDVVTGDAPFEEARRRLARIVDQPTRSHWAVVLASYAGASAASTRFLQGDLPEAAVAAIVGLATGLLALAAARRPAFARIYTPVAATCAAFLAVALSRWIGVASTYVATLAGLIVLIPGLPLTVAMTELASRHLSSGVSRLFDAGVTFLSIGFGVALGTQVADVLLGDVPSAAPHAPPGWTELAALLVAPVCFGLLLKARFRDLGWVLLGSVAAYGGTRLGAAAVGPQIGAFAGTFVLGMASNFFARHSNRPAALTYVPGVMLLVPGSIGLRGVTDFLAHNVSKGLEAGFNAVLVAVALASGMLLATVVVPARRAI